MIRTSSFVGFRLKSPLLIQDVSFLTLKHSKRTISTKMTPPLESATTDVSGSSIANTRKPTSILHRTPWQPPIALSGQGSYIELEDGRRVIDAVGGAAVACIGNGHPEVTKAMKDQIDTVSCEFGPWNMYGFVSHTTRRPEDGFC